MAGITLAQAQTNLDSWIAASAAVAKNQSYSINGRSMTRADAGTILDQIKFWEAKVNKLQKASAGGRRIRYGVAQ